MGERSSEQCPQSISDDSAMQIVGLGTLDLNAGNLADP